MRRKRRGHVGHAVTRFGASLQEDAELLGKVND